MAEYTMRDLEAHTGKTAQSIHKVLRTDEKLIVLVPKHKKTKGKRNVVYDDAILNALLIYYGMKEEPENQNAVAAEVGADVADTEPPQIPLNNPPMPPDSDNTTSSPDDEALAALQGKIEALEKELEEEKSKWEKEVSDLEKQLQDKEAERLHFVGENAKLINLLAAEKQEKNQLLLLMPPAGAKPSVWSKFKRLFTRKKEAAKNE